ncbi:MAG: pilus assembly PilX N-terminal domain-containing protein [Acidobacteria bacterium]|nr:pilus assembly PilX N-terminal domain-containing protein [Acidobacteriota bacterium]
MTDDRRPEAGFALILAMLALLLLTFLGITLSVTTTTELQISSNYRLGQQAQYIAEAGLEVGKGQLRSFTSWEALLPTPRNPIPAGPPPQRPGVPVPGLGTRNGLLDEPTRSWENETCDTIGKQGYGVVFDSFNFAYPFQNVSTFHGTSVSGNFTIWIRRDTMFDAAGNPVDDPSNEALVMTVEGTAPLVTAAWGGAFEQTYHRNRAVRILEAKMALNSNKCDQGGQESGGSEGSGNWRCTVTNN